MDSDVIGWIRIGAEWIRMGSSGVMMDIQIDS
jgi:hypothetical protein